MKKISFLLFVGISVLLSSLPSQATSDLSGTSLFSQVDRFDKNNIYTLTLQHPVDIQCVPFGSGFEGNNCTLIYSAKQTYTATRAILSGQTFNLALFDLSNNQIDPRNPDSNAYIMTSNERGEFRFKLQNLTQIRIGIRPTTAVSPSLVISQTPILVSIISKEERDRQAKEAGAKCALSDSDSWSLFARDYRIEGSIAALAAQSSGSTTPKVELFKLLSSLIKESRSVNLKAALQELDRVLVLHAAKPGNFTKIPEVNNAFYAVDGIIRFQRCDPQSRTQSGSATSSDKITLKVKRTVKGVTISGKASPDAGELTLWTKSKGSSIWNSQKVKIRFSNSGTFSANLRLAKNDLPIFMRVQQEGTGSFSNQVVAIR